jgi:hypothetical protein
MQEARKPVIVGFTASAAWEKAKPLPADRLTVAMAQCRARLSGSGGHDGSPPYLSEPGVVSSVPVSSQVLRPDRTIGQPP